MPETVLIGITTGDHKINSAVLAFCIGLAKETNDGRKYQVTIVDGAKGYDFPRNQTVKMFLESTADRLWFMDNDTIPPMNAVDMLKVDADIVTGLVPVYKGSSNGNPGTIYFNCYEYLNENDKYKPIHPDVKVGSQPTDAGGCACMIIKRHVLEDKRMYYSDQWTDICGTIRTLDPDEAPPVFRVRCKPNGMIFLGEDMDFCFRAQKWGYSIRCFTGTQFGHLKEVNMLDFLIMQQAMYEKGRESAFQPVGA